jgi:uncharacterized membrane protein
MSRETGNLQSTATVGGHPIRAMLVQFPIVCFVGAFVTDIVYWRSMSFIWETFSAWLLTAGLVGAGLVGLVDFVANRRIRQLRFAWIHVLGNALVIALSLVNVLVHSRDGYTAVVPTGIILSGVVVLIMVIKMITSWMGGGMVFRHRIGVTD